MRPDLLGAQTVDVCETLRDEVHRIAVKRLEVVRGVPRLAGPLEPQPPNVLLDRIDILDVLFRGVGVVEAEVAGAAELCCDAKVEADGFGVADVQVAVRLGGKPRGHTAAMFPGSDVVGDDRPDEIQRGWRLRLSHRSGCSRVGSHNR
jgi:hypothetical protein